VLEGLRVLDLADASGYLCGRTLADLGADVVRVERPGGDPGRWEPPFADDTPGIDRSLAWLADNSNKRSLVCDLDSPEGREQFTRLAAVADVIVDWKKTPGTVGIRIMMTKEAGRNPNDPGLDRILRAAVRHDFPINMLCWGNVDAGATLIDRHPDARFIIDHLGIMQPRTPPAPPQPWADLPKVLDLAKRPNAVIKVSGACTLAREPYPFPDIWDPLARVFDAWGFDRCLWGTDWTRAFAVVNYQQAVEPFRQTDRLSDSERAMLMGGACAKAYGWSPKKS